MPTTHRHAHSTTPRALHDATPSTHCHVHYSSQCPLHRRHVHCTTPPGPLHNAARSTTHRHTHSTATRPQHTTPRLCVEPVVAELQQVQISPGISFQTGNIQDTVSSTWWPNCNNSLIQAQGIGASQSRPSHSPMRFKKSLTYGPGIPLRALKHSEVSSTITGPLT
jgi:hypothetical protein